MDSKKPAEKEAPKKKKEQPEAPKRGRVIINKTFTTRLEREEKKNG